MSLPKDSVLLITGTSRGIGRGLAEHYLAHGHIVVGCSRKESDLQHDNYRHHCLDVNDEAKAKAMFSAIHREFGRLDGLINNAGIASMNHALLTPVDTVRRILETNFVGTFLMAREASRLMMKRRFGRIVNMATIATPLRLEGESIYAASKAAVVSYTQVLAKEVAPYGVTVNAVGPNPILTDLIAGVPQEKMDRLIQSLPLKRYGELRDVINVIDFFLRPESDNITGQVIYLGGA